MQLASEGIIRKYLLKNISALFFASFFFLFGCRKIKNGDGIVPQTCTDANSNCPRYISEELTLNPSGNAPLTGIIRVVSNQPILLSYKVKGQDGIDFTFSNKRMSIGNDTAINLFGLYPATNNLVTLSIQNKAGLIAHKTIEVQTAELPPDIPQPAEIKVNGKKAGMVSHFILLFPNKFKALSTSLGANTIAVDDFGKVRWYFSHPLLKGRTTVPAKNGHWFVLLSNSCVEIDLMGNVINNIALANRGHHDVCQAPNGDLIYLGESNQNNTVEDKVYRVSYPAGAVIDSINIYNILDPLRKQMPVGQPNDWLHCNSIVYNEADHSVIISGRNQSAVFSIDMASKRLNWILADTTGWKASLRPFLLKPVGAGFEHSWGQHSAILKPGDHNTILVFDNGNDRSYENPLPPTANYSRCVEYTINATAKTVIQNFSFGKSFGSVLYAPFLGNVQYLNDGHMLAVYGGIYKDQDGHATELSNPKGQTQIRIFETDKNQQIYFDLSVKNPVSSDPGLTGFFSYRAYSFSFR